MDKTRSNRLFYSFMVYTRVIRLQITFYCVRQNDSNSNPIKQGRKARQGPAY